MSKLYFPGASRSYIQTYVPLRGHRYLSSHKYILVRDFNLSELDGTLCILLLAASVNEAIGPANLLRSIHIKNNKRVSLTNTYNVFGSISKEGEVNRQAYFGRKTPLTITPESALRPELGQTPGIENLCPVSFGFIL